MAFGDPTRMIDAAKVYAKRLGLPEPKRFADLEHPELAAEIKRCHALAMDYGQAHGSIPEAVFEALRETGKLPLEGSPAEVAAAEPIRARRLAWVAELRVKIAARKLNPPRPSGRVAFGRAETAETAETIAEWLTAYDRLAEIAQSRLAARTSAAWWVNESARSDANAVSVELLDVDPKGQPGKNGATFFDTADVLLTAEEL